MRDNGDGLAPPRVLVIDDEPGPRRVLERAFTSFGCEVESAADGVEGLAKAQLDIDLLVVDAQMPELDGFEVARRMRAHPELSHVPILMVTGLGDRSVRLRAVEAGINDFIQKPFDSEELRLRSVSLLKMKQSTDALKRHQSVLSSKVEERTAALRRALDAMVVAQRATHEAHLDTIHRLVLAAERRDHQTAQHIERISRYCGFLSQTLGQSPSEVELLEWASPMHDVGKVGVPDAILRKPGPLDAEEWEVMKQHTVIGAELLHGSTSPVLQLGEVLALTHHERWDGGGYPHGLAGEAIPVASRILAIADVFDALTSCRPYRPALSVDEVFGMIAAQRGQHFDPALVDVFFRHRADIEAIHARLSTAGP